MKKILQLILIFPQLVLGSILFAQADSSHTPKITQLTIMVVPRTNDGQDVRTVLDQSSEKRIGIAKIKEAFDKRGFRTIDFVARLNAAKTDQAFTSLNPADAKAKIIEMSGTDLYVEADVIISQSSPGLNSATVPLQCFDASSGVVLGTNSTGCQRTNSTTDIGALVGAALGDVCLQNFLNSMQAGFDDLRANGRPIKLIVQPSSSSKYNMLSKVGATGKNITTLLTEWLDDHTVNQSYNVLGSSKLMFNLDAVKIKLLDNRNRNYRPFSFGNDVVAFLSDNTINADSEVRNGTVYITIN